MIVRLTGGMCNQLFMYAFGRSLSKQRHEPVKFHWARSTWDYALKDFNVRVELVNPPVYNTVYDEKTFGFDKDVYSTPPDTYFRGYWQTEKYFVDPQELRDEVLTLNFLRYSVLEKGIDLAHSTFIHVRRGDYLNPGTAAYHGNLGHASLQEGYYKTAIDYVTEKLHNPRFVVFTDDPEWCRQNLPYEVISGTGFSPAEELYLMSHCLAGIGANSTFSWWGNWLGEGYNSTRLCIAPKQWFNAEADTQDIIPDRWVRL